MRRKMSSWGLSSPGGPDWQSDVRASCDMSLWSAVHHSTSPRPLTLSRRHTEPWCLCPSGLCADLTQWTQRGRKARNTATQYHGENEEESETIRQSNSQTQPALSGRRRSHAGSWTLGDLADWLDAVLSVCAQITSNMMRRSSSRVDSRHSSHPAPSRGVGKSAGIASRSHVIATRKS